MATQAKGNATSMNDDDDAIAEEEESSIGDANEGSGGLTRTRDRDGCH